MQNTLPRTSNAVTERVDSEVNSGVSTVAYDEDARFFSITCYRKL